jgi:hypothetical protein
VEIHDASRCPSVITLRAGPGSSGSALLHTVYPEVCLEAPTLGLVLDFYLLAPDFLLDRLGV